MYFAGHKRKILADHVTPEQFTDIPLEIKADCRDAIYKPTPLLQDFIKEKGNALSAQAQRDIREWERYRAGQFIALKHLKKHTILLSMEKSLRVFGVLGITTDLSEILPAPSIVETVLLPFRGVIICDGIVKGGIWVGRNMEHNFNRQYMQAKRADKIITTL